MADDTARSALRWLLCCVLHAPFYSVPFFPSFFHLPHQTAAPAAAWALGASGGQWVRARTRSTTTRARPPGTAPPPASPSVPDGPRPPATPGPRRARPPTPPPPSQGTPACLSGAGPLTSTTTTPPRSLVSPALMTCVMYVPLSLAFLFYFFIQSLYIQFFLLSLCLVPNPEHTALSNPWWIPSSDSIGFYFYPAMGSSSSGRF